MDCKMTSIQDSKARRRWTFTRTHDREEEESSEEDYGQEILPVVDRDALATLPFKDQEKFKKMRKRDRRNVVARWKKEGKLASEASNSNPTENIGFLLQRSTSAPQLPELQMDVTHGILSGPTGKDGPQSPIAQRDSTEQSFDSARSELPDVQHLHQPSSSPIDPNDNQNSPQPYCEIDDSEETALWLRVMDSERCMRGRRRVQHSLQDLASTIAGEEPGPSNQACQAAADTTQDPSACENLAPNDCAVSFERTTAEARTKDSVARASTANSPDLPLHMSNDHRQHQPLETVEERRLKKLHRDSAFLKTITRSDEREYARSQGVGPTPAGWALSSNAPTTPERAHARTATSVYGLPRLRGQSRPQNVTVAPQAVTVHHSASAYHAAGQEVSQMSHWPKQAGAQGVHLNPPNPVDAIQRPERLREGLGALNVSPVKRMAKKVGAGIKDMFRGRGERAKALPRSRPTGRLRLHDETRLRTATAITLTPLRAPHPTETHHLHRKPPSLQPALAAQPAREGSPIRRTTRAMMEAYPTE